VRAVDSFRHQRGSAGRDVTHSVFGTMTAAAWTLYAYLWLPAITLVAWVLGLRTAWVQNVLQRASVDRSDMWLMLALVVLLGCALVLWAEQQRRRFSGVERRLRADDVVPEQVATSLGVPVHVLADLQGSQVLTVHHDEAGRPVRVEHVAAVPGTAARVPSPRRPDERATTRA
jgi:biofilm PGA synthesis protein PgaD